MHRFLLFSLTIPTLLASTAIAQTQLVRGKVEDVRNTQNQFFLDCTNLKVVSTTMDLNKIVGLQGDLLVVNTGSATNPVLDVHSFTPAAKIFDMGNLDLNKSARWQVNAAPGTFATMMVAPTSATGYLPLGPIGTWLLGLNAQFLASGVTNGQAQFEISFTMPNAPELVGISISGQAFTFSNGNVLLSNPDCTEVRAN
jgi:hypothetical protein